MWNKLFTWFLCEYQIFCTRKNKLLPACTIYYCITLYLNHIVLYLWGAILVYGCNTTECRQSLTYRVSRIDINLLFTPWPSSHSRTHVAECGCTVFINKYSYQQFNNNYLSPLFSFSTTSLQPSRSIMLVRGTLQARRILRYVFK